MPKGYFVRWNEHNPFVVSRMGVGKTLKDVFEAIKEKYTWLSPGEAIKAMTNGAVNVVLIPGPPSDEGEKRVWAWFALLMADDAMSWMCLGPFTGKEVMELANTWSGNGSVQYPVKIKVGDNPERVFGPGDNQYEMVKGSLKGVGNDLLATALEYFSRIEGEKGMRR